MESQAKIPDEAIKGLPTQPAFNPKDARPGEKGLKLTVSKDEPYPGIHVKLQLPGGTMLYAVTDSNLSITPKPCTPVLESNTFNIPTANHHLISILNSFFAEEPPRFKSVKLNKDSNVGEAEALLVKPNGDQIVRKMKRPELQVVLPVAQPIANVTIRVITPTDDRDNTYKNVTIAIHACFKTIGKFRFYNDR